MQACVPSTGSGESISWVFQLLRPLDFWMHDPAIVQGVPENMGHLLLHWSFPNSETEWLIGSAKWINSFWKEPSHRRKMVSFTELRLLLGWNPKETIPYVWPLDWLLHSSMCLLLKLLIPRGNFSQNQNLPITLQMRQDHCSNPQFHYYWKQEQRSKLGKIQWCNEVVSGTRVKAVSHILPSSTPDILNSCCNSAINHKNI